MYVVGFSRKGFLYIENQDYLYVFAVQVNHSESHMLETFRKLPEFDTLDEAKAYMHDLHVQSLPVEGDYIPDPNPEC